jgi:RNA polymerase sigma-70 factor (ECF subfamily)
VAGEQDSGSDHRRVHASLELDEVRRLMVNLPKREKEALVLRIFEDFSVAQTAGIMGCREGTVKALLFKALKKIREAYGDE